jgi:uncharacterized membrane protein YgcG
MSRILLLLVLPVLSTLPLLAAAAGLVPCGGAKEPRCETCHVMQLVNGVIGWLVLILGTVAAIIIVYAGFKLVMSGGNRHAMEDAKELISNMLIGYVIVLAGWLLIDTGMKMLLTNGETPLGMWNQLQCTTQPTIREGVEYVPEIFEPNQYVPSYVGGYSQGMSCSPLSNGQYNCIPQIDACVARQGVPTVDRSTTPAQVLCAYPASGTGGSGSGGSTGGGNTGGGGSCQILTSGPCSVENLRPIFGARAEDASRICNKESGGTPIESGSDICCGPDQDCSGDAPSFSGGLFQVNIIANANLIPGCTIASFYKTNCIPGKKCQAEGSCVRRNGRGICTGWSCSIVRNEAYNTCMRGARNSQINLQVTKVLYARSGFSPWANSRNICGVK